MSTGGCGFVCCDANLNLIASERYRWRVLYPDGGERLAGRKGPQNAAGGWGAGGLRDVVAPNPEATLDAVRTHCFSVSAGDRRAMNCRTSKANSVWSETVRATSTLFREATSWDRIGPAMSARSARLAWSVIGIKPGALHFVAYSCKALRSGTGSASNHGVLHVSRSDFIRSTSRRPLRMGHPLGHERELKPPVGADP